MARLTAELVSNKNAFNSAFLLLMLFVVALTSGCGSDTGEGANGQFLTNFVTRSRAQPLGTGVSGRVISAVSGVAIAGATVSASGVSVTSGVDGSYNLTPLAATDRVLVTISAANFATAIKVVAVIANRSTPLTAQLLPIGVTQALTVATGGTVSVAGSTAQVVIPAACLVRTDGGTAASDVSIAVTAIPPAADVNLMSGEYMADASGTFSPIESFGAMLISAQDSSGATYTLGSGCSATIRIPVSTRVAVPPGSSPLFYLDETTGRWIQSGTGTLAGTAPSQYYGGTVTRFGYWNADQTMSTINVSGCINDQTTGQPIANALVTGDGINYSSLTSTRTASDGTFTLPIKLNGSATIVGLSGTNLTNTVVAGPSATNITLPACLLGTTESFGFNVRLTWGATPSDIDSHLKTPTGAHIDWTELGTLSAAPYAALDVDDTNAFGPEVVTSQRLYVGTYRYFLHNFSRSQSSSAPGMTPSPTRVELNFGNSLDVFTPPAGEGANLYWHIFDVVVDAQCSVTLTTVNTWSSTEPAGITSSSPTLCTG